MTDDTTDTTADDAQTDDQQATGALELAASSTYKVRGEIDADDGTGVLGRNIAKSGTPIGVEGAVPNAEAGYGLSTPHDARVDGIAELGALAGALTGGQEITDLVGSGLQINGNSLEATGGSSLWEDAGGDGLLNPSESGDDGIGVTNVQSDNLTDNGSGQVTMGSTLDLGGNDVTDAGTIDTKDNRNLTLDPGTSNSLSLLNLTGPQEDNVLTIDSAGNVGISSNTSADIGGGGSSLWEDAGDDGLLNPSDSGDDGIGVTNVNTDNLTDNGSGQVTMGSDLDFNGNTLTDTSGDLSLSGAGNVAVSSANLDVQSGTVENTAGSLTASTGAGDLILNPSGTVDLDGNVIDNIGSTTTASAGDIRLGANGTIKARDSGDSFNIDVLTLDGNDNVTLGSEFGKTSIKGDDVDIEGIDAGVSVHIDPQSLTFGQTFDVNGDQGTNFQVENSGEVHVYHGSLNLNGYGAINVNSIDNGGTAISVDDSLDLNGNNLFSSSSPVTIDGGGNDVVFPGSGDLDLGGNSNVTNTSDARLKTAIEPIDDPVERLLELDARTYEWEEYDTDEREAGVLAQSVQDALPEAVTEGDDGVLKLSYRQLTPLVISAVQDHQDDLRSLEADLDANDARIEDQDERIERLESRVERKDDRIDDLEAENEALYEENAQLRERNAELEARIDAIEDRLGMHEGHRGVADD